MLDVKNLYNLYMQTPPLIESKITGEQVRHGGSTTRCAFWRAYDGIVCNADSVRGSWANAARRAGRDYRKKNGDVLPKTQ